MSVMSEADNEGTFRPATIADADIDKETLGQRYQLAVAYMGRQKGLSNDQRLHAYGLYKQVSVGNCTGPRPFMFDPVGCAKYDAWHGVSDTPPDAARHQYIALASSVGFVDPALRATEGGTTSSGGEDASSSSGGGSGSSGGQDRIAAVMAAIAEAPNERSE